MEHMDLIIVAGQSNAVGFDTRAEELPPNPTDTDILFHFDCGEPPYDNGLHNSSSRGAWLTLGAQPQGNAAANKPNFRNAAGGFGPEIGIARTLHHAGLTRLAVLKFAYSATGFCPGHWNPGDPLHRGLVERYGAAVTALAGKGHAARLRAVFWHQGESDANALGEYPARLQAFIDDLRRRWAAPDLPFVISVSTEKWAHNRVVGEVQRTFAETAHRVAYVNDLGCGLHPSGHYDSAGTLEIGVRMGQAFLRFDRKNQGIATMKGVKGHEG